jgi:hypothetical protein
MYCSAVVRGDVAASSEAQHPVREAHGGVVAPDHEGRTHNREPFAEQLAGCALARRLEGTVGVGVDHCVGLGRRVGMQDRRLLGGPLRGKVLVGRDRGDLEVVATAVLEGAVEDLDVVGSVGNGVDRGVEGESGECAEVTRALADESGHRVG